MAKSLGHDHSNLLHEVLQSYVPLSDSDGPGPNLGQDVTEQVGAIKEYIAAGIPCMGTNSSESDYVIKRFCMKSGWSKGPDGKPTQARDLFDLYVKAGMIRRSTPVNATYLAVFMNRTACALEFAVCHGLNGLDATQALLENGFDIQELVGRRGFSSVDEFIMRSAPVTDAAAVKAVIMGSQMSVRIDRARAENDGSDVRSRRRLSL